jgi:hypothetical protein
MCCVLLVCCACGWMATFFSRPLLPKILVHACGPDCAHACILAQRVRGGALCHPLHFLIPACPDPACCPLSRHAYATRCQLGPYKVKIMLAEPKTKRTRQDLAAAMGLFGPIAALGGTHGLPPLGLDAASARHAAHDTRCDIWMYCSMWAVMCAPPPHTLVL